ncbi:MAG: hypothetical protein V3U54_01405 [Thermodesulfobacteriota bacterium]
MSRFSTSWALMKSSCEILKKDKELAVYPVLSSIASVIVFLAIAVLYFVILAIVQSTFQTIFQAALYKYAKTGEVPSGFDKDLSHSAILAER